MTTLAHYTRVKHADGPDGFTNSFKVAVTTAESTLAARHQIYFQFNIKLEAQDVATWLELRTRLTQKKLQFLFGSKSSVTGTYTLFYICIRCVWKRTIVKNYTINSANTWEHKTITFDGDTSGSNKQ